nr:hypothetical protein [Tanacetum cinerariifolium]
MPASGVPAERERQVVGMGRHELGEKRAATCSPILYSAFPWTERCEEAPIQEANDMNSLQVRMEKSGFVGSFCWLSRK